MRELPDMPDSNKTLTPINWVLVFGTARSGTSYMTRMVGHACRRFVGDWGLRDLLIEATENKNAYFNTDRLLTDISNNILTSAQVRKGTQFDLVFKQAGLSYAEYKVLVKMWGKHAISINCFRIPDEFIQSATKKFPNIPVQQLQQGYSSQIKRFSNMGGQLFEYHAKLSIKDYLDFLAPIDLGPTDIEPFIYKGSRDQSKTTTEMWVTYEKLLEMKARQQNKARGSF